VFISSGCSSSKKVSGNPDLLFQKWDLVWLNGDSIAIDSERPVYIEFDKSAERVSGFGGCNRFFANFTTHKNELSIKAVASTKMACINKEKNKTENILFQKLSKVTSYQIVNDHLTLFEDNSPVARFSISSVIPGNLAGLWELIYINGRRIAFNGLYPDKKPSLLFKKDQSFFSGFTSCNQIQATYQNKTNSPLFLPGAMTLKACPGEGERVFLNAFKKANHYSVDADTLSLYSGKDILMKFEKKYQEGSD